MTDPREDIEAEIAEANRRIIIWSAALMACDDGEVCDIVGMAIDHASDEIARLEARLDTLDDELGWRRSDDPGRPVTL